MISPSVFEHHAITKFQEEPLSVGVECMTVGTRNSLRISTEIVVYLGNMTRQAMFIQLLWTTNRKSWVNDRSVWVPDLV